MNTTATKIQYFVYARKSSEKEDRQILSIDSQKDEMTKLVKQDRLAITDTLQESHSAKAPGRPIFDAMIQRIERGEANGILVWHPNRISRNSVDTGKIIYLLDLGKLLEVRTPGQIFRNTPNDKFLLNLFCSQAKLENDNKGVDVKRGLNRKVQMGWYPCPAYLGYLNTPEKQKGLKIIVKDPERFDLVRKMFDLMLTGRYTVPKILYVATNEWKLRSKNGGIIAKSSLYRMFSSPFYYGVFEYPQNSGDWHRGQHEPTITADEYDRIQVLLDKKGRPRPKTHLFPYTGMMKCGECNSGITAEEKIKRQKNGNVHRYIYYHCTKKKNPRCSQRSIECKNLEAQITEVLKSIEIPDTFYDWALECIKSAAEQEANNRNTILSHQQRAYTQCVNKIDTLIDMRAGGEIGEEEFRTKKGLLTNEKLRLQELLNGTDSRINDWLEAASKAFAFARDAREEFQNPHSGSQKAILNSLGSNLILYNQKLSISLQESLLLIQKSAEEVRKIHERLEPLKTYINKEVLADNYSKSSTLLRAIDEVRTCLMAI